MLKILIADDHVIIREGLKKIIDDSFDMKVVDEASNGQEVFDKVRENDYDGVVLDISMPGKSGLEILKDIKAEKPELPVLVLSMYPEEQYAVRVLKAGASGYLTKESAPDELISALQKITKGRKYVSSTLAELLAFDIGSNTNKQPHEILSDREFQVMCMIALGKTVKEIGEELLLSVKTISTYRARVLDKMNMKNNSQLTHYAIQNKLV